MSGTVVFQVGSLATPGPGIVIGQDNVNGTAWQYVKLDIGVAGASSPVTPANPLPVIGTFQQFGTNQALGTFQAFGTSQVLGTVQLVSIGTQQVLGSVQTVGTSQVLGTVQPLAGSVHIASSGTLPLGTVQVLGSVQPVGTVQALGTVRTLPTSLIGENFFGTLFTAGQANGTLVAAPAQGTFIRIWDMMVSGSAAGTAAIVIGSGTIFAPGVFAANGGFVFNSARGVRTHGTSQDILFNSVSGTWGVSVNYSLET